jgi:competence protein ComEC
MKVIESTHVAPLRDGIAMPLNNRIPNRAPALYLIPGLLLGLLLARAYTLPILFLALAALTSCLISLWVNQKGRSQTLWVASFLISTTLAFWTYGLVCFPAKPSSFALSLPEREATLVLDIERVYNTNVMFRKTSGIARIVEASSTSPAQVDSPVYFRLKIPEDSDFELLRGQQLQVTGVLYTIKVEKGEDSFEAYLKDSGIHYTFARTSELSLLKQASAFDRFCMFMNERFEENLRLGAPADTRLADIYVAMLLGKKAALSDEQSERFRMTGTMHFFAISGLHIGVIATVIAQCLLLIRVPRRYSPWIGLPLLYLYVEITGASPSAVRAFLMAACFWLSYAIVRQRSPLGALAASAVAVLLIAPEQLWSLGFQLSYTVVLSILLFGLPLYEALGQRFRPFQLLPEDDWSNGQRLTAWSTDKLILLFSISFSAWLASAPLSAGLFGFIAPSAVFLNMLLVYLAALVITSGVVGLSLATIGLSGLCGFINHASWVCLALMNSLVKWSVELPKSILICENFPKSISYASVVGFVGIIFWMHRDRTRFDTKQVLIGPVFIVMMLCAGYLISDLAPR